MKFPCVFRPRGVKFRGDPSIQKANDIAPEGHMLRILEVGIGLALVFTLVALICSIVNEWISAMLEKRGNLLWEGIENLVGQELRGDICGHQLMQGLVRKQTWFDAILKRILPGIDRAKPSYVPTEMFVATLLDIIGARAAAGGNPRVAGQLPTTFAGLQTAVQNANGVPDNVKQALLALVNDAGGAAADQLEKAKKHIGDWFDAGMGRVTGWYKRWSQLVLILVGLGVAFFLGVDCIAIAKRLWTDPVVREQVAQAAEEFVDRNQEDPRLTGRQTPANAAPTATPPQASDVSLTSDVDSDLTADTPLTSDAPETPPAEAETPAEENQEVAETETAEELAKEKIKEIRVFQTQLEALSLPLFPMTALREEYKSKHTGAERSLPRMFGWWLWHHLLGFVLTSFAASLGAPFWFDLLNRFVNLRNTGKKPEEAPAKR
jgi:hypothetical protein